jgi:membrane-associated phospholipid phosphatase
LRPEVRVGSAVLVSRSSSRKTGNAFASFACSLALCFGAARSASAQAADAAPSWNPKFTHFTATQYAFTIAGGGGWLASGAFWPASDDVRWRSEVFLDHQARNLFAATSEDGRRSASNVSDYLMYGLAAYPFVVDAMFAAGVGRGNYHVALQLALIGAQSMLVAQLVTSLTKRLAGRARPDADGCKLGHEMACASSNQSFISGHTSAAFTGAGLICATQQNLDLYGSELAGAIACGLGLGAAATVGTLRMVADRHHMTDVLAGAAVGLAAGYLLPNLTNFDFGARGSSRGSLMPLASRTTAGLAYLHVF